MEVKEAVAYKEQLEEDLTNHIGSAIKEFGMATGLKPHAVHVVMVEDTTMGGRTSHFVSHVVVSIDL